MSEKLYYFPFFKKGSPMSLRMLFCAIVCLVAGCSSPEDRLEEFYLVLEEGDGAFDLWIRNGTVYNGVDTAGIPADVLIRADSIAYLGEVDSSRIIARRSIDASGKIVTPGFIDAHAHGDPLSAPEFRNFLAMGVTTICLGQDGSSPSETDLGRWMERVDSVQPGVNIAMFAGHGTLRRLSGAGYKENPTEEELEKMQQLLRQALEAGAYGMSTGLEYTPGVYAGEEELLSLAQIVGEANGLIMSHVRNEDDEAIEASLRELLRQGRYCSVHASHLKVVYGKGEARAEDILSLLDSARQASDYLVTADVYPYNASYTGIGIVFPDWAKAPNDYATVRRERRAELLAHLKARVMKRNGPEATLFGTSPFAGKTLQQLSEERGQPFEEVLMDIGPGGASGAYFVMDQSLQARLLADPHVMVSSDGSPTMHHPRGYGSFAKIIEQYVNHHELFSLHEAIRKMSSLTANTIGITDRGVIEAGKKGDLLIFDPGAVRARADFTEPQQLAQGFDYVIVNGKTAIDNGAFREERFGKVLRRTSEK